jgi:hypothetical protein
VGPVELASKTRGSLYSAAEQAMVQIGHLNIEGAKAHPEAHFSSPQDLVEEVLLTRGEKLATLQRWRERILRQLAAEGSAAIDSAAWKEAEMLDAIEQARRQLMATQPA